MVKYIGADKSGGANDSFRTSNVQPSPLNNSDKSFQFAAQQQQQLGESLKNSLVFQSQTAARMSEDFSRTNTQLTESSYKALQVQASDDGFDKSLKNLASVGKTILQTLDERRKAEAASAKAVREQNAATMWDRVSQWEVDAPQKARLDPGGIATLRNEASDLLNSTEGSDMLPEDREKLMRHIYGNVIGGLASKNVEDLMTQQRKVNETNDNVATQRAIFGSSSLLSSLANSGTREEQSVATQKLSEYVGAIILSDELKPGRKAEILLGLTTAMNKAVFSSEDNQAKSRELVEQFNAFQQDVAEARSKFPDDVESQNAAIAYSAFRNKIPTSVSDNYDMVKAQQRAIERVQLNNKERELRSEEISRSLGVAGTNEEAGYDAEIFATPAALEVFATELGGGDANIGKETPRYRQVVAAQRALREFQRAQVDTNQKYAQLQQQKARIAQGDAQANLTYIRSLKPSPQTHDLIKRLQIASGNNPALASMLPLIGRYDALDKQRKAEFDNAYAQATAQGFSASNELIAAIDSEARVIQQRLSLSQREIVRYGYGIDGRYDPTRAKAIEQRRIQQEAKRQADFAANQQYGSQGGTTDGAPFDRNTQYFNGLEVFEEDGGMVMPITKAEIKRQGKANINEGVGWRAWAGRQHNGQDIGVDLGTPISAQMNGKVTRVWGESDSGAGSSGNTVEVTYSDGSRHVFMHLMERSSLTVGQQVRAGQVVGKAGNTGLAGGNANKGNVHLHWEVWNGDTRSTPQEWSKKYKERTSTLAKQPRGGGPGSSITAPVRGVGGIPIKGGVLLPDGKGGASVASYSGLSQRVIGEDFLKQNNVMNPDRVEPTVNGRFNVRPIPSSNLTVVTLYKPDGNKQGVYTVPSNNPLLQGTKQGFPTELQVPYSTALAEINTLNSVTVRNNTPINIRDSGQQKQRPSIPPANTNYNGKIIYGPDGTQFGRDSNGNVFALPKPVGVSSGGVTSSPANYNNANPLRNLKNSNRASDYNINDVTNTHGFKALQDKPNAARAINEVARDFGVPGEWLAEVISVETGNTFDPNQKEYGGSGATGLIQFFPDRDGGSTKTVNGIVYNLSDIGRMTIEQQLRGPVKAYITEAMRSNGMKKIPTIQDLYALVWAYGPASKARRTRDMRGASGNEVLNRLGKFSGRRYSSLTNTSTNIASSEVHQSDRASKLTTRVDKRPHASCVTCTSMVASNMFVPHERVNLNTGMNTFNIA